MLKQRRGIGVALNLFTLLAVVSNGWLGAIPKAMAEAESAEQPGMVDAVMEPTLDQAVAIKLLQQIELASSDLREGQYKTQAWSAIARGYSAVSDHASAAALLNKLIIDSKADPDTQLSNLHALLNATSSLSHDTAVTVDLLHQLLAVAQQLPTAENQASILVQITHLAHQLPAQPVVNDLMQQILALTQPAAASVEKGRALTNIATFYISASEEVRAIDLLNQALVAIDTSNTDESAKYYALLSILHQAAELSGDTAKVEMLDQALTVINNVQTQELKSHLLVHASLFAQKLSEVEKANQLMAEALTLAEAIPEDWSKATALYVIAGNYKDEFNQRNTKDLLSRILSAAGGIQEEQYQLGGLLDVVGLAGRLSNQTVSRELLVQALAIVNGFEDSVTKAQGLLSIAESYREVSDEAAVRELLLQVLTVVDDIDEPSSKRSILHQVVSLTVRLADQDIARDVLGQGLVVANAEQNPEVRVSMLLTLAERSQTIFAGTSPLEQISQALLLVEGLQEQNVKADALYQTAQALYYLSLYTETTDWSQMQAVLSQVLETSKSLQDDETKMVTFVMLGYTISELPIAVAQPLTEQLMAMAKGARTTSGQIMALNAIARIQANHNHEIAVQNTLGQAIALIEHIQGPNNQIVALYRIADSVAKLSEDAVMYTLASQMLTVAADMEDDSIKAAGINAALRAVRNLSDGDIAQQLFNQMFAIADTLGPESEQYRVSVFNTMATTVMAMAGSDR